MDGTVSLLRTFNHSIMKKISDFFNKATCIEDTIPNSWRDTPTKEPPKKKRRVGRPCKVPPAPATTQLTATSSLQPAASATSQPTPCATPKPTTTASPQPSISVTQPSTPQLTVTASPQPRTSATHQPTRCATPQPTTTTSPQPTACDVPQPTTTAPPQPTTSATNVPAAFASPSTSTSNSTTPQSSIRGKYKHYSFDEKLKIADEARQIGLRPASVKFKVAVGTLHGWMKLTASDRPEKGPNSRRRGAGRKLSYDDDIDDQILSWFLQKREQHIPVSQEMVMSRARGLIQPCNANFLGSRGWLRRYMKRHNLVMRRASFSQKLPADLEGRIKTFHEFVRSLRCEVDYDYVINMDETPAYFDLVPTTTMDEAGTKTIKIRTTGGEKRHLTVVLAVTSEGEVLPTTCIFKGKRQPKNLTVPNNTQFRLQEKGWMDEVLMLDWIKNVLRPFTDRNPSLLVMDSYRAHLTDKVKKELRKANCDLAIIPGGCTSVLQPLDVSINRPYKAWMRREFTAYLDTEVQRVEDAEDDGERIQTASKEEVLRWVSACSNTLSQRQELIKKSFIVTGITPALNGTDDHWIRNDEYIRGLFEDEDEEEEFEGFVV